MPTACAAFDARNFTVFYQPRFALTPGEPTMTRAEALLRRADNVDAPVFPLIAQAERDGHIGALTEFVARRVCRAINQMLWAVGFSPCISINISPALLQNKVFINNLRALIKSHSVDPQMIEFEITESCNVDDYSNARSCCDALRDDGFGLALDDFGTGLSGLRRLDMFPVSAIKLDRHFIGGIGVRQTSEIIVSTTADIARQFGITAVAEGIETEHQLNHVIRCGYQEAQGFMLARPMPLRDLLMHLHRQDNQLQPHTLAL